MERARRHARLLSVIAFGLLALGAELVGRSLTAQIDVGRHVHSPNTSTDYYPILLAVVKLGIALLLARLCWRIVRAHAAQRAARRALAALGAHLPPESPRFCLRLSPRLWAAFFAITSGMYLVQMDAERAATGRWPLLAPWLHSSAWPVFAVLSVLMALVWGAVQRWLAEYEEYADAAVERALRAASTEDGQPPFRPQVVSCPPRRLFGLAFESRPPPLFA